MQYIQAPSGAYIPVKDGISYNVALKKAREAYPQDFGIKPQEGIGAALGKGWEQLKSSTGTGIGSIFGNAPEAAAAGAARSEAIGQRYADQVGWDKVAEKYNDPSGGLFSAAGEVARQVPYAIAEQAANIGATVGAGGAGRLAGAGLGTLVGGPVGGLIGGTIGGVAGSMLPSYLQQLGGNVERQQAATPGQINVPGAAATALPQAALDVAGTLIPLGRTVTGKILGPQVTKWLERGVAEGAEKLAKESLLKTLAKGTAVGAMAEIPTEVAQQMLERMQAGLSLTDASAQKEYADTAYQVGLLAPIGGAGRYVDRSAAKTQVEETKIAAGLKERRDAAAAETARKQTPEYLTDELIPKYDALKAQHDTLKTQIKDLRKAKGEPNITKAEKRGIEAQIKNLSTELHTTRNLLDPVEEEYGARASEIAKIRGPEPVVRGAAEVPAQEQQQGELFPERTVERIPAAAPDYLRDYVRSAQDPQGQLFPEAPSVAVAPRSPQRRSDDPQEQPFPAAPDVAVNTLTWQETIAALLQRPDLAKRVLSNGELFPGAPNKSTSNLWKKELAKQLRVVMAEPKPAEDSTQAYQQIIADREQMGNEQLAADMGAGREAAAQQSEAGRREALARADQERQAQESIAAEVRGAPERDATANAQLRAAEEAGKHGIAPAMPEAAAQLRDGVLTPEAAAALRIRMTTEPLDLTDKATAKSLVPQIDKRLATLENAANKASAFELTDAQGNLNEQGQAYQRLMGQITELRGIKARLANTIENPVPPLKRAATALTGPAPEVGAVELRPLDRAKTGYETTFDHAMGSLDQIARGEYTPETENNIVADARDAGKGVVGTALQRVNAARAERNETPLLGEVQRVVKGRIQSAYDALVDRARRYDASPVVGQGKNRTTMERVRAQTDETYGHIYGEPNVKNAEGKQADTWTKVIQRFHKYIDSLEGARPPKETLPPIEHKFIRAPLLESQTEAGLAQQRAIAKGEGRPGKAKLLSHVEHTLDEIETLLVPRPEKVKIPVPKKGQGLTEIKNLMKVNYEARAANAVRQNMDPQTRALLGKAQQFLGGVGRDTTGRVNEQFMADIDAVVMRTRNGMGADPALARQILGHIQSIERNVQSDRDKKGQYQRDLFESAKATAETTGEAFDARLARSRAVFALEKQNEAKMGRMASEISNLQKRAGEQDDLLKRLEPEQEKQFAAMVSIEELSNRVRELDVQLGDEIPSVELERLRDGLAAAEQALSQSTHFYGDAIERFHEAKQSMARMLADFHSLRGTQERVNAITETSRTIKALEESLKRTESSTSVRTKLLESAVHNVEVLQKRLEKLSRQKKATGQVRAALENAKKQLDDATKQADRLLAKPASGQQLETLPRSAPVEPAKIEAPEQPKAVAPGTAVVTSKIETAPLEKLNISQMETFAAAVRKAEDDAGHEITRAEKAEILNRVRAETPPTRQIVTRTTVPTAAELREVEKERIRSEMEDRDRQRKVKREFKVSGLMAPLNLKQRAALLRAEDDAIVRLEQAKRAAKASRVAVIRANEFAKRVPSEANERTAKAASDANIAALKEQKAAEIAKKEAVRALNAGNTLFNVSASARYAETAKVRREAAGASANRKDKEVRKNLPRTGKGAPEPTLRTARKTRDTPILPDPGTPPAEELDLRKAEGAGRPNLMLSAQLQALREDLAALNKRKADLLAATPAATVEDNRQLLVLEKNRAAIRGRVEALEKAALSQTVGPKGRVEAQEEKKRIEKAARDAAMKEQRQFEQEQERMADEGGMSRSGTPATGSSTVEALNAEVAAEFGDTKGLVTVVPTRADMPVGARAVTIDGARVYIAADEVGPGQARGLVLHELGVHIGMDAETVAKAHAAIEEMAQGGGEHAGLAKQALEFQKASESTSTRDEAVAHFVELASNAGISPTSGLSKFFKPLIDMVRKALAKFGLRNDKLTAQDIVDYARGAVDKAVAGSRADTPGAVQYSSTPKYADGYDAEMQDIENRLIAHPTPLRKRMRDFVQGFRMSFIDSFDPAEKIASRMDDSVKAMQLMYGLRMYKQASNATNEVALNGTLYIDKIARPDGKAEYMVKSRTGDNLRAIAKILHHAGVGDQDAADRAFKTYLIAERAERTGYQSVVGYLKGEDGKAAVTEAELKKALEQGRLNTAFQQAREMYQNYSNGLLDFAVDTGALSKREADKFKSGGDYVSFYRLDGESVNLVIDGERIYTVGNIKSQPHLKRLVGDTSQITGFLEGALQNTRLLTEMALRNMATKNLAETLSKETYIDEDGKSQPLAHISSGPGPNQRNVVRYMRNGEPKYAVIDTDAIGVPTDILVTGLEGVATQLPVAFRFLGVPSRLLRHFIVRNPLYAARQVVRDSLANAVLAGVDGVPVASQLKEIGKMVAGRSNAERHLQERLIVGGLALTGDMEDRATIMKQIGSGEVGWQAAMAKLDFWAMQADAAARVTAYNSAVKNGATDMEATMAALETMNFNRKGASPTMHALGTMIPFMNAQIQGLDVLYRSFAGKMPLNEKLKIRRKLAVRGSMLFASSLAYAMMMSGDDGYEDSSMSDKLQNWQLPTPWGNVRIPTPFEAGYLFKALPEAMVILSRNDKQSGAVLDAAKQMLMNSMPGVVPQGLKPFIEDMLNKEFYSGRDIEDQSMLALKTQERYGDKTPELLKGIGGSFEVAGREIGVSPARLEHYVRGFTGALGIALIGMADSFANSAVSKPTRKLNETPVLGPLFVEKDATAAINEAYKMVEQYTRAKNTYEKLAASGREKEADAFFEQFADQIARADAASSVKADLGALTKEEAAVRSTPTLSGDEKREILDTLRKEKIKLSRMAMEALR